MFLVKFVFYFTHEVDNNYISFVALPLIKYEYVHFSREIKDIFNKNIWMSCMYLRNAEMSTFANSKHTDEMQHTGAFHQGLHYF